MVESQLCVQAIYVSRATMNFWKKFRDIWNFIQDIFLKHFNQRNLIHFIYTVKFHDFANLITVTVLNEIDAFCDTGPIGNFVKSHPLKYFNSIQRCVQILNHCTTDLEDMLKDFCLSMVSMKVRINWSTARVATLLHHSYYDWSVGATFSKSQKHDP